MSQTIVSRMIASVTDKRASIANGQLMRQLEMLDDWNTIRVGLQVSWNASASALGQPTLWFGIGSGVAAGTGYGDGNGTKHCVGIRLGTSASWTYHAGPPAYFDGGTPTIVKKVGSSVTSNALATGYAMFQSAAPTSARTGLILQIVKGSPNFSLDFVAPQGSGAAAQADCNDALFLALMEMAAMSNAGSIISGYANWGSANVSVNEGTDGVLDSVNIFWDKSTPPVEISAVGVRKVA